MADIVKPHVRSRMMSDIKGENSKPKFWQDAYSLRRAYVFRLHRRDLPGTPDIVLFGRKIAIFVHDCFWHAHIGYRYFKSHQPDQSERNLMNSS